jgi:hypothetical protein
MEGRYTGSFSFGPNQIDSVIDETYITAYKVYFADSNMTKLGSAVTTITVTTRVPISTCGCNANLHTVTLNMVDIPAGSDGFMIVVVDLYGFEMPVGTYIGGLADIWTTTTTTTSTTSVTATTTTTSSATATTSTTSTITLKPVVSGAPRTMGAALVGLLLALATLVA